MNFISCFQLQHQRLSEILLKHIVIIVPITHNPLVVLVHMYSYTTSIETKPSELEIVDTFDWCCEETYRVRAENEKQEQLMYVKCPHVSCSMLPVDGL